MEIIFALLFSIPGALFRYLLFKILRPSNNKKLKDYFIDDYYHLNRFIGYIVVIIIVYLIASFW